MKKMLEKKGYNQIGEYYAKILTSTEMEDFLLDQAEGYSACLVEVYPEEKKVQYALFPKYPSEQDISNANIFIEDDYSSFMEYLQG